MIRTREEALSILRDNLSQLHRDYGVRKLALFGSVARNSAEEGSDVDLLVEFDRPIGLRFVELAHHLEVLLEMKIDLLTQVGVDDIRNRKIAESIRNSAVYV